jgi:hypothetical protein
MDKLFEFCAALDRLHVYHDLQVVRDQALVVTIAIPGERLEIEFFADGNIEIERFVSQGVEAASNGQLDQVLQVLSQ